MLRALYRPLRFLLLLLFMLPGCGRVQNERFASPEAGDDTLRMEATLPAPLEVGTPAALTVRLTDAGTPVSGAVVRVVGSMAHAGMEPLLLQAPERAPGVYEVDIPWTMGGEWVVQLQATLSDGRQVEEALSGLEVARP